MELLILAFCLLVVLLSSLVIYCILSKPFDNSFEEAKANQKKILKQYQDQTKSSLEKAKDKKTKKSAKKPKKAESEVEFSSPKDVSSLDNDSKVAEANEGMKQNHSKLNDEGTTQLKEEAKKSAKTEKQTKKTVVATEQVGVVPANAQKKEVGTKSNIDKPQATKSAKKKSEKTEDNKMTRESSEVDGAAQSQAIAREVVPAKEQQQTVQVQQALVSHSANKQSKKKRAELSNLHQLSNEKEAVNINLLVSLVQKAELSRTEIQLLIDALLNKQQEDISEWLKGRQDPQVKLQKQLAEVEQALKDEKQISTGLQVKLKELRNEMNSDKAASRHMEEMLNSVQNDWKTNSIKLQQAVEENQVLNAQLKQCQKQLADEQKVVRKLQEDQGIQQQITEKQCHEAVMTLQAQVNQYAAQSQELQAANNSLRNEVAMLQENDLRIQEEYRDVHANLERALAAATYDATTLRNEVTNLERALADSRAEIENLGGVINGLKIENQRLQEQNKQYVEQCSTISKENEALKDKLSENLENGYSCNNKQEVADYEARLEENKALLKSMKNEIEIKNKKIDELSASLSTARSESQNAETSLQKATMEIASLKLKTSSGDAPNNDHEDSITQLKNILNDKNRELASVKSELDSCKLRNNELRNKNWKVVEALTKAEQSLQNKIMNEQNSNDYPNSANTEKVKFRIQRIVKHLHPEIHFDNAKTNTIEEWLQKVEEAVSVCNDSNSTSSDLETQNNQLRSMVQHYKTIITETEGMLNQLQNHVEVEESRWKEKLLTLEEQIDSLKQNQNK